MDDFEYKGIFVNEKMYKIIVDQLGYAPENLEINKFLPDDNAYITDFGQNHMFVNKFKHEKYL